MNIDLVLMCSLFISYFCKINGIKMKQLFAFIFFGLILLSSCHQQKVDVSTVTPPITIGHFDHAFFAMDSMNFTSDLQALKKDFPDFFRTDQDEAELKKRFLDPQIRELYNAVDTSFMDLSLLDDKIYHAFQHLYHYFPTHKPMRIHTWVSNFERLDPILVSDQSLLISLDMYLGPDAHFYQTAPNYIKQGFDKKYLLTDMFSAYFSESLPLSDDNSLLASMLHYGKIHYLTSLMLPDASEEMVMGYAPQKMSWCFENESDVWAYFIENKLLFSSMQENKRRFIEDAPFSKFNTHFDRETPGRIGRWMGWNVIRSYMKANPEKSLIELMNELDAQKILRESRYKPKS